MYMHTYTHIHTHTYTYICTCTHTRIHARTYTYACICTPIHREKISAKIPLRVKQYHRRTYVSIHVCMHIHIYMHIHICAHPAASVWQMCTLMSKNTCVKYSPAHALVPRTPVPQCIQHSLRNNEHTCIHTCICKREHTHTNTHVHP